MAHKIEEVEGIGPTFAKKFIEAKIRTTDDLIKTCMRPAERTTLATKVGVSETQLEKWAKVADLMRIKGIGGEFAELLDASGVHSVVELKTKSPQTLAESLRRVNEQKRLTRTVPNVTRVSEWIEEAKKTAPVAV